MNSNDIIRWQLSLQIGRKQIFALFHRIFISIWKISTLSNANIAKWFGSKFHGWSKDARFPVGCTLADFLWGVFFERVACAHPPRAFTGRQSQPFPQAVFAPSEYLCLAFLDPLLVSLFLSCVLSFRGTTTTTTTTEHWLQVHGLEPQLSHLRHASTPRTIASLPLSSRPHNPPHPPLPSRPSPCPSPLLSTRDASRLKTRRSIVVVIHRVVSFRQSIRSNHAP